ncbi:MAG: hypothetical protein GX279_10055 [Clostridiaceae bacterium]|nr:hypothetical protein [Clostridiaceae bacterium]
MGNTHFTCFSAQPINYAEAEAAKKAVGWGGSEAEAVKRRWDGTEARLKRQKGGGMGQKRG